MCDYGFQAILNHLYLKMRASHLFFSHSHSISGIQDSVCSVKQGVNVTCYVAKMKKQAKKIESV